MSDDNKVIAELRENFGKGFARRLRADGKIPAVIYGHGTEAVHVALPGHQVGLIIRRANAVLDLQIGDKEQLTLVKDVQRDPVRQIIEHIDLLVVKKGERVQVEVPVQVNGESFSGTISNLETVTLLLDLEATAIPQNVVVDIEGREEGAHVFASDIVLPKGAKLVDESDLLIVTISVPAGATAEEEAEEAAAEAAE